MKVAKIILLLIIIPAFSVSVRAQCAVTETMPDAEIMNLKGKPFRLIQGKAKVKVILFWATWCLPCRLVAKDLNNIHKAYARKGVEVIGLTNENPKTDLRKVKSFVRWAKIKYKIGWVTKELHKELTSQKYAGTIPVILVVNSKGQIDTRFIGYDQNKTHEKIIAAIKRALDAQNKKIE